MPPRIRAFAGTAAPGKKGELRAKVLACIVRVLTSPNCWPVVGEINGFCPRLLAEKGESGDCKNGFSDWIEAAAPLAWKPSGGGAADDAEVAAPLDRNAESGATKGNEGSAPPLTTRRGGAPGNEAEKEAPSPTEARGGAP